MGFTNGAYARIWSKEEYEKFTTCQLSVSKKNKETGAYDVEFQDGYVTFIGKAHKAISEIGEIPDNGLSIRLISTDTRNKYDKEKSKKYTNFLVFEFEIPDGENSPKPVKQEIEKKSNKKPKTTKKKAETPIEEDDDLPF